MPHRRRAVDVFDATVGPQVRPTDAGGGQPDDGVGGLDDLGVVALLDANVARGVEDGLLACGSPSGGGRPVGPDGDHSTGVAAVVGVPAEGCTGRAPQIDARAPYPRRVDNRREIRDFLTSRRAKVTPEQTGLRTTGTRRVPGLRRSEVAQLAGVSVEYYSRLERGDLAGVSDAVLEALSRALQLDDAPTCTRSPATAPRRRAAGAPRASGQPSSDCSSASTHPRS